MKSVVLTIVVFVVVIKSYGQTNGVYLSKDDFSASTISSLKTTGDLVKVDENFNGSVTLSSNGQVRNYKFGTVYGYCNDGVKYRKYGSKTKLFSSYGYCKVMDESALIIYSKQSRHHRSNGYVWHYYSKSPTSEIKLLTLKNLKRDFSDNPGFIDVMSRSMKRKDYLRESNGRLLINEIYISKNGESIN